MNTYTSYLKADFFENGIEQFETGYTSQEQAQLESQNYVDDQYNEADRPEVIVKGE